MRVVGDQLAGRVVSGDLTIDPAHEVLDPDSQTAGLQYPAALARADRRGDVDRAAAVQDDRGVQHPDQLLQAPLAPLASVGVQDEGELVASEAADRGARARPGGEPTAVRGEDRVPDRVAHGVVHGLEMVGAGNARVRGFRERRDDDPTRLSALEAVSEAGSVRGTGGDRS
ncbi:hypothetical protein GCM10010342_75370 [Streptomyces anulatus]|nr:hypothetical protein IQ60_30010 [Streptomyces europaeiscabiei]GGY76500.1 hypothetical protein GCM10010342_75370 [Streptomyces anulatus]